MPSPSQSFFSLFYFLIPLPFTPSLSSSYYLFSFSHHPPSHPPLSFSVPHAQPGSSVLMHHGTFCSSESQCDQALRSDRTTTSLSITAHRHCAVPGPVKGKDGGDWWVIVGWRGKGWRQMGKEGSATDRYDQIKWQWDKWIARRERLKHHKFSKGSVPCVNYQSIKPEELVCLSVQDDECHYDQIILWVMYVVCKQWIVYSIAPVDDPRAEPVPLSSQL